MLSHGFHKNYRCKGTYTQDALAAAAKAVCDILILGVSPGFIALPENDFLPYATKIAKAALDAAARDIPE
jgi:hypothetical protein